VTISREAQHYKFAIAFLRQGDLPQATHHFRVGLGLRLKDGLAPNVYLGVLAWHAGQAESARQAFEAALRVYDSSKKSGNLRASICLELRSCALLGLGRAEEAESALRQALACRSANDGLPLDDEMWRLLQSCEHPPQGLERLTALLSSP
jgi:Flp pilus assembly protein TadD